MTSKEKLALLDSAYVTKKVEDSREEIKVINETLSKEVAEAIKAIQFKLNYQTGTFELDYEIMQSACYVLSGLTLDELSNDDLDIYELCGGSASVYTSTRLGYLNNQNQSEITDIMREYECDIATACADWYDKQTTYACEMIRAWVLEDNS